MPFLRLVTDEPESDPPAPLSILEWRRAHPSDIDPIAEVERALERSQAALSQLTALVEEDGKGPIPFPGRDTPDDDGPPYAA